MNTQIRNSVFETNSSSSHSLTMGTADLRAPVLSASAARQGVISVSLDEYGWEYRRIYTLEGKLSYLLTQLAAPPYGESLDKSLAELRDEDARVAKLCDVVKEFTGCDIRLDGTIGGIDHQSEGRGLEVFNSDDLLRRFLFSEDSYVQTGNDNDSPPLFIHTDDGRTMAVYAEQTQEVPPDYVEVVLTPDRYYSWDSFFTKKGALLSEVFNPSLFKKLLATGIVVRADLSEKNTYTVNGSVTADSAASAVAAGLRIAPEFKAELRFEYSRDYQKDVKLTVAVPVALAKAMFSKPQTPKVLHELSEAKIRLKQLKERKKETRQGSNDLEWLNDALAKAQAAVKSLTQQAKNEGAL